MPCPCCWSIACARYLCVDEELRLEVRDAAGDLHQVDLEKDADDGLGLEFSEALFDGLRQCNNACPFCFIDQQPPGRRSSLYLKDDDYRLSFLYGSYLTLTNLTDADWRGEVTLGTNLFSEWCTSVLDDPDRRPTIAAEATVTGGTLTFTSSADPDGCGGPDVRASVDGLEVTTDDGTTIVLGSLALRSPLWGCQAG